MPVQDAKSAVTDDDTAACVRRYQIAARRVENGHSYSRRALTECDPPWQPTMPKQPGDNVTVTLKPSTGSAQNSEDCPQRIAELTTGQLESLKALKIRLI